MANQIPHGYSSPDLERWLPEPDKSAARTEFARDRARVMHSSALRRLAVKTQVMEAGQDDFPRTRLTHSLECAQIGRELGLSLGADPDLVDTACLAHDLGHPPFGHNGENELNRLAENIGGFEGNAQSFRILTRIEPKTISPADGPRPGLGIGLNLTRASLDAASKYPWPRESGSTKFGAYEDDREVFDWARQGAPEKVATFEAQVMDWSDDVSYCTHDIEDAIHAGHIDINILKSSEGRHEIIEIARDWYGEQFDSARLDHALVTLNNLATWPGEYDGTVHALAALKNLTSTLIGRFCVSARTATIETFGEGAHTRYSASLIVPEETRYEVTGLKALAARFVMGRDGAEAVYARQRDQIASLHALLSQAPEQHLDHFYGSLWHEAQTDQAKARVVIDQIAGLTDVSLVQRLSHLQPSRTIN